MLLKIGIEIHQQLDTHKLFCLCPSAIRKDEPDLEISRKLHVVSGEGGKFDRAAVFESGKEKEVTYEAYSDTTCLIELDEEPPRAINQEAVEIGLGVSKALSCKVVPELQVMRKLIIDGSCTSGFQRTAILGYEGKIDDVGISYVCLEEDSCRITGEGRFRVDRLGIPLLEITTEPDIRSPEHAKEIAKKLGNILRCFKVKRGLGTIRQDLNVSADRGKRVEIKGVQNLDEIPGLIREEVRRQENLIDLFKKLKPFDFKVFDVSGIFKESECNILRGKDVFALVVENASGLFRTKINSHKTLGSEIAGYVKAMTSQKGYFHTDEALTRYKITNEERTKLRDVTKARFQDLVCFVSDSPKALEVIYERIRKGPVVEETRRADGTDSDFLRPAAGSARMYPETDVEIVAIDPKRVKKVKLPDLPKKKLARLERLDLSKKDAEMVIDNDYYPLFRDLKKTPENIPSLVQKMVFLEREGRDIHSIDKKDFAALILKDVPKEKLEEALIHLSNNIPLKDISFDTAGKKEIEKVVKELVKEKKDFIKKQGEHAKGGLMGLVMGKLKGRAKGSDVLPILEREIEKIL
jgi:glutamyl-tRNA(Gln) amidotransferase subunit E